VSARSHVFTDEQLANLTAITWLYRGEHEKFVELLATYQAKLQQNLSPLADRLTDDGRHVATLAKVLSDFVKTSESIEAVAAVRDKLGDEHGITDERLQAFRVEAQATAAQVDGWQQALGKAHSEANALLKALAKLDVKSTFEQRKAIHAKAEACSPALKVGLAALEARHKTWLRLLDLAEKTLRARQWADFAGDAARGAKKALLPRDVKKREVPTVRDLGVEVFRRASYFISHAHWLLNRFPSGLYEDVPGLCKAVSQADIKNNDFSLTPGRYVGAALGVQDEGDGEAFIGRMREIHSELADLNDKAAVLAAAIQTRIAEIFE